MSAHMTHERPHMESPFPRVCRFVTPLKGPSKVLTAEVPRKDVPHFAVAVFVHVLKVRIGQ